MCYLNCSALLWTSFEQKPRWLVFLADLLCDRNSYRGAEKQPYKLNENTVERTGFWLSVWKKWCIEKKITDEIENYEPAELKTLFEHFYAEVKNKQGEDYEPESLKVMIASLDRHFKNKGYSLSIVYVHDRKFSSSKQLLEGKAKQLCLAGRVKRPTKLDKYQSRKKKFSERVEKWEVITPKSLFQTMWWLLTQHIRLCGRQEHHGMRLEDFRIMNGDDGLEFVEFAEGPTKTRLGGLSAQPKQFQPKMFHTGEGKCPVTLRLIASTRERTRAKHVFM